VEKDLKVLDLFIQQTTEQSEEDDRAKGYAHYCITVALGLLDCTLPRRLVQ
jgi:hypothetical protein